MGNECIINTLRPYVQNECIPNMIWSGPPGCGKTSAMRCIVNDSGLSEDEYLELNASNERGVETVRNRLKSFSARKGSIKSQNQRIIFLDEADGMTQQAQMGLKVLMDVYRGKVVFIIGLNDITCLHNSLKSRCVWMKFEAISNFDVCQQLIRIVSFERMEGFSLTHIGPIADNARGDLRSAINALQMFSEEKSDPNTSKLNYQDDSVTFKNWMRGDKRLPGLDHVLDNILRSHGSSRIEPALIREMVEIVMGKGSFRSGDKHHASLLIPRLLTASR